jgi:hypothetical protein
VHSDYNFKMSCDLFIRAERARAKGTGQGHVGTPILGGKGHGHGHGHVILKTSQKGHGHGHRHFRATWARARARDFRGFFRAHGPWKNFFFPQKIDFFSVF